MLLHAFFGIGPGLGAKEHKRRLRRFLPARKRKPGKRLRITETLGDDEEVTAWVSRWNKDAGQDGLLLGIDAPLLVPNLTGKRPLRDGAGAAFCAVPGGGAPGEPNDLRR